VFRYRLRVPFNAQQRARRSGGRGAQVIRDEVQAGPGTWRKLRRLALAALIARCVRAN
jgi:hypothetical protein